VLAFEIEHTTDTPINGKYTKADINKIKALGLKRHCLALFPTLQTKRQKHERADKQQRPDYQILEADYVKRPLAKSEAKCQPADRITCVFPAPDGWLIWFPSSSRFFNNEA